MRHANDRYWHLADIVAEGSDVRFGVETGHHGPGFSCLLCATSSHSRALLDVAGPVQSAPDLWVCWLGSILRS
jgi:hypothetical protein